MNTVLFALYIYLNKCATAAILVNNSMFTKYSSTKALPYVYLCKEKTSERFYIGYRYANKVPSSEDFGVYYFTSNTEIKNNFENFDWYIVAEFFNKNDAYTFESEMVKDTRSEFQINYEKSLKITNTYGKHEKILIPEKKICPLPECGNEHTNWRSKCCCISHSKKYAGMRAHKN
jgi:hypothetical protein